MLHLAFFLHDGSPGASASGALLYFFLATYLLFEKEELIMLTSKEILDRKMTVDYELSRLYENSRKFISADQSSIYHELNRILISSYTEYSKKLGEILDATIASEKINTLVN